MELGNHHEGGHPRPLGHSLAFAVVSGDSESSDGEDSSRHDEDEDIFDDCGEWAPARDEEAEEALFRYNPSDPSHADDLYDRNLDDEDEAYVYRNMRGGLRETVMVRETPTRGTSTSEPSNATESNLPPSRPMQVLKPRNTDAVLSCPCCFNIVCMDCQRHQKYMNQFRAMFVMGITVDWHSQLIYSEDLRLLVPKEPPGHPNRIPEELNDFGEKKDEGLQFVEGEYFPVLCRNCRTQVAALDMLEEVYHFHGCLESS